MRHVEREEAEVVVNWMNGRKTVERKHKSKFKEKKGYSLSKLKILANISGTITLIHLVLVGILICASIGCMYIECTENL